MGEQSEPGQGKDMDLGQDAPHSARMYDYFLGGKTNYAVDREAAEAVARLLPAVGTAARVNRAFMHRAVRTLAELGVRQFIDVGTGIPTSPNLHEVVQAVAPESRVAYVDNDPIVLVYADELLDGSAEGETCYVQADAARPDEVIAAVKSRDVIDFEEPVALSLNALLHFMPGEEEPYRIVGRLFGELAPGSYLSVSHATGDFAPEAMQAIVDTYTEAGTPVQVRTRADVERFFDGLEMLDPGLVVAHRWRPEPGSGPGVVSDAQANLYAGVGRKP